MSTPFFVFTSPRTGSAWLIDLLASHPAIEAHGELLLPGGEGEPGYGTPGRRYHAAELAERARPPRWPTVARGRYVARALRSGSEAGALGFKLMYGHADRALLLQLALSRARAVHLVRRNVLASVVSYRRAKAAGLFHARVGDPLPASVHVDCATLVDELESRERAVRRARETLRRHRLPTVDVAYEELERETGATLERVARFLRVEPARWPATSVFVRMREDGEHPVANLAEVRAALAGSRFAWMVEELAGRPAPT